MKSLLCFTVLALLTAGLVHAAEHGPGLDERIAATPQGRPLPVVLFLDNRLTMDDIYPTAVTLPQPQRRAYVAERLQTRFHDMGDRVMAHLEAVRKEGRVTLLRPLWILNGIRLTATVDVLKELDEHFPEVGYVVADPEHKNTLDDIGWGVAELQAPLVWSEFGATGEGVIVGHKDAGLDIRQAGFEGHLWINPGEDIGHDGAITAADSNGVDDDGNGYTDDFWGWCFDRDDNDVRDNPDADNSFGHGTKTASVISATNDIEPCDTISVAPGAKLMELSAFLAQGAVWEASQYALQMGAMVISASESFKQSDCQPGLYSPYDCPNRVAHRLVSEMELAAGMIHANSAGNQQSPDVPRSFPAPSDCPPPAMTDAHPLHGGLSSIVSVNAYGLGGNFSYGGFGPAAWSREDLCVHPRMAFCGAAGHGNEFPYDDYPYHGGASRGLSKPDVTSPTGVPSLGVGSGCSSISGTSGATPHVGGALALVYSKFPGISPEATYLLLAGAAQDAGAAGYDSIYGFGKIRPYPAIVHGMTQLTLLTGTVTDVGGPRAGVRVSTDGANPVYTGVSGVYNLWLNAGLHDVRFEVVGLPDVVVQVSAIGGMITLPVSMSSGPEIVVTLQAVPALSQMQISIPKGTPTVVNLDDAGTAEFHAHAGRYEIIFGELPYRRDTLVAEVAEANHVFTLNFAMSAAALPTGPDSAGYRIYDNFDSPAAAYEWQEINGNAGGLPGEPLFTGGDGAVQRTLPFTFRYYGVDVTQISVSGNGFVVMGSYAGDPVDWATQPIPSSIVPNNLIAPYWADWEPQRTGAGVYYYSQSDSHRVIIEWYHVETYDSVGHATFQCMLYDPAYVDAPGGNGTVRVAYQSVEGRARSTVGIENPTATDGVQYLFEDQQDAHSAPLASGRALLLTTDGTLGANAATPKTAATPREFALYANYPNPFNPTTTFVWSVPRAAAVKLALFDILGREAAVIFDGTAAAGEHRRSFDATGLATGVYFARLETGGQAVAVRKVLLLK